MLNLNKMGPKNGFQMAEKSLSAQKILKHFPNKS